MGVYRGPPPRTTYENVVRRQISREIEILRTNNPFVVHCHGMYDHDGKIQILLEHMDSRTLDGHHIDSEPFLAVVTRQVLAGLAYLHRQNRIDSKPYLAAIACQVLIGLAYLHRQNCIDSKPFLAAVARQVLAGLAYLHRQKIIHRDIKPSNLLINATYQFSIINFGVSQILAQTIAYHT